MARFGEAAPAYGECCDRADVFCVVPEEPHEDEEEGSGEERTSGEAVPVDAAASASASSPPEYENGDATSQLSVEVPIILR